MKALRSYQTEAIAALAASFASGHTSPCLVLPTGSGKTATVLAYLAQHRPNQKVLWLAPRVSLIDQTWRAAKEWLGDSGRERLAVSTVQALVASTAPLPYADVCVVDEAHFFYGTPEFSSIAKSYPVRVAATATPTRVDYTALRELCDDLIVGPQRRALVADGFLPRVVTYAPEKRRSTEAWGPVDAYQTFAAGERAIVFCRSVQHAKDVRDAFSAKGHKAGAITIDGGGDLELHRAGFLDVLTNVFMVSVGYDDPTVSCVISARPFGNATSYIQAAGRARALGMNASKVIDLYGACHEWGLSDEDRLFSLEGKPIKLDKKSTAPLEVCAGCRSLYRPNPFLMTCPTCAEPAVKFQTPKEKRRAALLEKYSVDTDDARFSFLSKMTAIARAKKFGSWIPAFRYRERYGSRPPIEWLEKVGLR